ncbi:MAG: nodulation protein NfeD, partial [Oscillochloris sp.]|nr:nodulation protein NfeD [Oscillochloris sp.]
MIRIAYIPRRVMLPALFGFLAIVSLLAGVTPTAAQATGPIYQITIDNILTRYTADYVRRAVREAEAAEAEVLIIQLSNQGAVLRVARDLAADLAVAEVPVVAYVAPA